MNPPIWKDPRQVAAALVGIAPPRPLSPVPSDLPALTPEQMAEGDLTEIRR